MKPVDFRDETFESLQERLNDDRLLVHRAWLAQGAGTTREVAAKAGIDLLTFRPRSTELYQLGLLELVDKDGHEGVYVGRSLPEWETYCAAQRQAAASPQLQLM